MSSSVKLMMSTYKMILTSVAWAVKFHTMILPSIWFWMLNLLMVRTLVPWTLVPCWMTFTYRFHCEFELQMIFIYQCGFNHVLLYVASCSLTIDYVMYLSFCNVCISLYLCVQFSSCIVQSCLEAVANSKKIKILHPIYVDTRWCCVKKNKSAINILLTYNRYQI